MSTKKERVTKPLPADKPETASKKPVFDIAKPSQPGLFDETIQGSPLSCPTQTRTFRDPNPRHIYMHGRRLDEYLMEAGLTDALLVRGLLRKLDFSTFHHAYASTGRAPYEPAAMLGLVLWGLMKKVDSLRALAKLARTDLECMWVCGGISPEFSVIGRFLRRHADVLTDDFFVDLTTQILGATGSNNDHSQLAGDGTIIQAMASRYRKWTVEAAAQKAEEATKLADETPDNLALQQKKN